MPTKLTFAEARRIVRSCSCSLTKIEDEYRVRASWDGSTYFTNDLADAIGTAEMMRGIYNEAFPMPES